MLFCWFGEGVEDVPADGAGVGVSADGAEGVEVGNRLGLGVGLDFVGVGVGFVGNVGLGEGVGVFVGVGVSTCSIG